MVQRIQTASYITPLRLKALIIAAVMVAIHCASFLCPAAPSSGPSVPCDCVAGSAVAPFIHANCPHLAINIWAFLSVVFVYDTPIIRIVTAYIASVATVAIGFADGLPIIGFSGVVFFLFGSISFEVRRKAYYQLCMLSTLLLGFLFPYIASSLHLATYVAGIVYALLNTPINSLPLYTSIRK